MTLAQRILARLHLTPVPVRTAVLIVCLGASRSRVWAALLRLERLGHVLRDTRRADDPPHRGKRHEAFWVRVSPANRGAPRGAGGTVLPKEPTA